MTEVTTDAGTDGVGAEDTSGNVENTATTGSQAAETGETSKQESTTDSTEFTADKAEETSETSSEIEYKDFVIPEGAPVDQALLDDFTQTCKSLGIAQDKAQALLEMGMKNAVNVTAKLEAEKAAEIASWEESSRNDKEFGGAKFDENMAIAKKGYDALATPELKGILNKSGLGNHPELIRAFYKAGKMLSEDSLVMGVASKAPSGTSNSEVASVLYG